MNIGTRISTQRKKLGLSQEQLAEKLNVSRQTVSKWENNTHNPELDKCMELCRLFQISLDELLLGEQIKNTGLSDEQFNQLLQEIKPTETKSRKWLKIGLSCCLILILGKLLHDNNYLNQEISKLTDSMIYLADEMSHQSSMIQNTIEEAIRSNDSIISNFKTETVHYDLDRKEVLVKFQIYPKQIKDSSKMSLQFSNEKNINVSFSLSRKDNYFEGENFFPLSDFNSVIILLDDQENLQQMTFNPDLNLLSAIAPFRYFSMSNGTYSVVSPNINLHQIEFTFDPIDYESKSRFEKVTINGKDIIDSIESYNYEIYLNQKLHSTVPIVNNEPTLISLDIEDNDEIAIVFHYTDSLGFHYRETSQHLKIDESKEGHIEYINDSDDNKILINTK